MACRKFDRAFVVGAYIPNGGTWMSYHLGRILQLDFGLDAIAVSMGRENAKNGILSYALEIPLVTLGEMEKQITDDDVLIVNPSFSNKWLGWRVKGFKISYVQHFSTFPLLDMKFDHYVAVSEFVREYLHTIYGISPRVIPPFVGLDGLPPSPPWSERPETVVLPFHKGQPDLWDISHGRLQDILRERAPHIELAVPLGARSPQRGLQHMPQRELLSQIGGVRYLLALSEAEGFGLVPLEAMALGTVVTGYDGFGGRQYMRPGYNCAVAPYPEIERVAELLIAAVASPKRSAAMAERGRETAAQYSYEAFRLAWIEEFNRAFELAAIG